MQPSSRTPEGDDNTCPVCGHEVRITPSMPHGDATCPHCGMLLWFAADQSHSMDARRAAILWARARTEIESNKLIAARQHLRRAVTLDPTNTGLKESLTSLDAQLAEQPHRKHRRPSRPQPH